MREQPDRYQDTPPEAASNRSVWGWLFVAVFSLGLLAATFVPAPYVIERPGPVFNVLGSSNKVPIISVSGAKTYPTSGSLDLLTVGLEGSPGGTPTWLELVAAWLDPSEAVIPLDAVYTPNQSTSQVIKQDTLMFQDSQQQATAAALRSLGYNYDYQLYVDSIGKGTPAVGIVKPKDRILTAAGVKLNSILALRAAVQSTAGKPVQLVLIRNGRRITVSVTPKLISGAYRIGVYAGTRFKFPIDVQLQLANVGGPSGGTMFALGVYDKLTPGALTGGQLFAGTGTIDESGVIGPIGGIQQKMYAAQRAGARWFLAPSSNCNEVVGHIPGGLQVVSVSNFAQALAAVKQIAKQHSAVGLPTCSAN